MLSSANLKTAIKVFLSFVLVVVLLTGPNVAFSEQVTKTENDYTIGEVERILFNYFTEKGYDFTVGSDELADYLLSQLIEDADADLAKHPQYDLILFYATEYIHELENYQVAQSLKGELNQSNADTFNLEGIKSKTIGQIKKETAEEEAQVEKEITEFKEKNPNVVSPFAAYSGTKARDYAYKWWNKRNSNYKSFKYDCTNFTSQVVKAGGKGMKKPKNVPDWINETKSYWYSTKGWVCRGNHCHPSYSVTTSWIRVTDFYSYWSKRLKSTTSKSKKTIYKNAKVGDIVQIKRKSDQKWYHSMVVTKKDKKGNLWFTYHSNDNKNKKFSSIEGASFRVIKFVGSK